jgi:hypothetical protein
MTFMVFYDEHSSLPSRCPMDKLEWYASNTLSIPERIALEMHLVKCPDCQKTLVQWRELRQIMRKVKIQTPEPRDDLFLEISVVTLVFVSLAWVDFYHCSLWCTGPAYSS